MFHQRDLGVCVCVRARVCVCVQSPLKHSTQSHTVLSDCDCLFLFLKHHVINCSRLAEKNNNQATHVCVCVWVFMCHYVWLPARQLMECEEDLTHCAESEKLMLPHAHLDTEHTQRTQFCFLLHLWMHWFFNSVEIWPNLHWLWLPGSFMTLQECWPRWWWQLRTNDRPHCENVSWRNCPQRGLRTILRNLDIVSGKNSGSIWMFLISVL